MGYRGGFITFHHVPSLKPLFTLSEPDNSIHAVDYSPLGRHFATGGKDFHIRVYDDGTVKLMKTRKRWPLTSARQGGTTLVTIIAYSQLNSSMKTPLFLAVGTVLSMSGT